MLYELIAIVRPGKLTEVKEIAIAAGRTILEHKGVVRGYTNWGILLLPKPLRRHEIRHTAGHHFIMRFDSSVVAQHTLRRQLGLDPRLLRFNVIKIGEKLEDICNVPGEVPWMGRKMV
ncbi:37S ribosomal protein Mrp17 [Aulographum hederae CBS 113979]|uniref:Small ribosomal subunit protein bS6m n=1 Tax=Aulographum hederae CBS 113979 TaxID=1176131 RepID=A0A6G1H9W6_9PEZI|nr:37S ribosomal protein Mrp17 [Aulographum hederae CBS 113979]